MRAYKNVGEDFQRVLCDDTSGVVVDVSKKVTDFLRIRDRGPVLNRAFGFQSFGDPRRNIVLQIAYYSGIAAYLAYDLPHTPGHFPTSLTFDGMEGKNNIPRLELLYGKVPKRGKDVSFQPLHLEAAGAFCLGDRALFIPLLSDNAEGKVGLLVLLLLFRTILLVGVKALH